MAPTIAIATGSHTRATPRASPTSRLSREFIARRIAQMLRPARYLADLARFVATRSSQEQHDRDALRELESAPPDFPGGLEVEWLGVSGYRMTYEGQTIFIDPYLSRVP